MIQSRVAKSTSCVVVGGPTEKVREETLSVSSGRDPGSSSYPYF